MPAALQLVAVQPHEHAPLLAIARTEHEIDLAQTMIVESFVFYREPIELTELDLHGGANHTYVGSRVLDRAQLDTDGLLDAHAAEARGHHQARVFRQCPARDHP